MIVCTFSTRAVYTEYARNLLASCGRFGLHGVLYEYPDMDNWDLNVKHKARAVLRAMDEHPGQDVLFLDADAFVGERPAILLDEAPGRCDVAVYYDTPTRPCGGTVWFHHKRGRAYAEQWDLLNALLPGALDDWDNLQEVLVDRRTRCGGRILHLPPSYCWIERDMRRRFPTASPVIEHFAIGDHQSYSKAVARGPLPR